MRAMRLKQEKSKSLINDYMQKIMQKPLSKCTLLEVYKPGSSEETQAYATYFNN